MSLIPVLLSLFLLLVSPVAAAHSLFASEGAELWSAGLTALLLGIFWVLYWQGSRRRPPARWANLVFYLTLLLAILSLLGPLDDWAKTSTAAHMTQHMLLMVVIAPLWVLCRPLPQLAAGWGRHLHAVWRPALRMVRHPLYMAYLHGFFIWFWHVPRFYMLAVEDPWWHLIEHLCFLLSAGVFWWAVLRASARNLPFALLALLFTLMHTGFLGALLTFASSPLYGEARNLQDQQLAGLIMWVAAAIPYLLAAAWLARRWYRQLLAQGRL